MYYFEVAPIKIIRANSGTFTYHAESTKPPVGSFVTIPVGSRTMLGVVMSHVAKPTYPTRPITQLLVEIPALPHPLLETAQWISAYYATHLATVLTAILPSGLLKKRRAVSSPTPVINRKRTHFLLNDSQLSAIRTLTENPIGTSVLHGITGSGKTAVYIEYARRCIKANRSVIVLVPEIALTSQLVSEFQHFFEHIIVTHSRQTEAERHLAWLQVARSSHPHIIIGPRSALFMPVKQLGVIIIDEAHEPSFKQDQAPKYSALRVASILGGFHQATVIQGSATPLVSEYYLALEAGRPIIPMYEKAATGMQTPSTTIVDMTKRANFTQHRFFSHTLLQSITHMLEGKKQCLIYHNRRGSASTTLCENCGWSAQCPRCYIPVTLHADLHMLRCHICNYQQPVPTSCPNCQSTDVIHKGIGTKLIESELGKLFPHARIARFDGDTQDNSVEKRYQALYDGEIDIIIGTQVIAKGLDLPHLGLVGVVQADAGLSLPDFTSSERTFQLIAQVVGRVGRTSHPTSLIIQSYQPTHPSISLGVEQNYRQFYDLVIEERRRAKFPPFRHLLQLVCTYKTEAAAIRNARLLASQLQETFPSLEVLGPTPAFYERQRDTYRWQITVKATQRSHLLDALAIVPSQHWHNTLDPYTLL